MKESCIKGGGIIDFLYICTYSYYIRMAKADAEAARVEEQRRRAAAARQRATAKASRVEKRRSAAAARQRATAKPAVRRTRIL